MKHETVLTDEEILKIFIDCHDQGDARGPRAWRIAEGRAIIAAYQAKQAEKAQPTVKVAMCPELETPCHTCPTAGIPCEAANPPTPSALLEAAEGVVDWIAGDYEEGSPEANAMWKLIAAIEAHKKGQV